MNILITSGIFPPDIGGPASYVPKIADYLSSLGHQVTVFCLTDEFTFDDDQFHFKVVRLNRKLFLPLRILLGAWMIRKLAKEADLVYANTIAIESHIGSWLAGKRIIHKVVGDYAWERARNKRWFSGTIDQYQSAQKVFRLKLLDFLRNWPLKKADLLIVPSMYLKNIVMGWKIPPDKIKVIYNAVKVDSSWVNPIDEPRRPVNLVTVCRLTSWKRVDGIIRVLSSFPEMTLTVVGDGPERQLLGELATELNLEERVTFVGHVSNEKVLHHLSLADLFILNSTYEGLPHVLVEAMLCHLPVICNDVGGCAEIVQHGINGYLMPFREGGQEEELKKALTYFKERPETLYEMARKTKASINRQFSFAVMGANLNTVLEECMEKWKQ